MSDKPNLLLIGIDSLRADHMSCYGYERLTTPHIDAIAEEGVLFEHNFCPHVPTTSGYGSMLSGMDCFGTGIVALRHHGSFREGVKTLAEMLGENGYETTCVGFQGNPAARGFHNYLNFAAWGDWEHRPSLKADNLNEVAIPELNRLAAQEKPFFLFLRHMDPHSPYLPPAPFERMFYSGNEFDPSNNSMEPVKAFKPFWDYFACWMPPGVTDAEYIIAQYDGAVAYMDSSMQRIFTRLEELGLTENTLAIINADHGETLYDHECWFDHHGMYDCTLHVPLIMRWPGVLPEGKSVGGMVLHQDLVPTIMDLLDLEVDVDFDGQSLIPLLEGYVPTNYSGFYITECTWMRKHGWRTSEWKLIHALEPDFHFKPEVELYNLVADPEEYDNLAESEPTIVAALEDQMQRWIAKREKETAAPNPMYTNLNWHGCPQGHEGPFESSEQAYNLLHIGDPKTAQRLQAREATEKTAPRAQKKAAAKKKTAKKSSPRK
ncbi:MAG: sulfatase family protein [Candidatus Zipacnadales bacterium]